MHCARPWDYRSLGLQFHPPKVTPFTNPAKVTDQGLCYCNYDARGWYNSHQSGVISITDQLILENGKKNEVYRRNNNGPKTLPCGTPDTTLKSLLRPPSTITCCDRFDLSWVWSIISLVYQYRQDRISNTHRAELIENAQMVDSIKGCIEVNLQDPSLRPTLQCTLQCMGHEQKCITGTKTFLISELGGWKHTTTFP